MQINKVNAQFSLDSILPYSLQFHGYIHVSSFTIYDTYDRNLPASPIERWKDFPPLLSVDGDLLSERESEHCKEAMGGFWIQGPQQPFPPILPPRFLLHSVVQV